MQWDEEMIWFNLHSIGNRLRKSILKLYLSAAAYGIWGERNARIFQQKSMDSGFASAKICNSIIDAMLSWRNVKDTQENREICRAWNIGPVDPLASLVIFVVQSCVLMLL